MAEAGSGFERKVRVRPAVAAAFAGIFLTLLAYFIAFMLLIFLVFGVKAAMNRG